MDDWLEGWGRGGGAKVGAYVDDDAEEGARFLEFGPAVAVDAVEDEEDECLDYAAFADFFGVFGYLSAFSIGVRTEALRGRLKTACGRGCEFWDRMSFSGCGLPLLVVMSFAPGQNVPETSTLFYFVPNSHRPL